MSNENSSWVSNYGLAVLGVLPQNWRYTRIEELEDEGIIIGIQDGNHGEKHPKGNDYVPSGIPFVMAKDLINNRLDLANSHFITREQAEGLRHQ